MGIDRETALSSVSCIHPGENTTGQLQNIYSYNWATPDRIKMVK